MYVACPERREFDSPRAAGRLIERILDSRERLAPFPESRRLVPELPHAGYREIIVQSYRVQYRLHHDVAWIMTVLHGRRLPQDE